MDPDQTAPTGEQSDLGLHCLSKMLIKKLQQATKQMIFDVIGVLRVNIEQVLSHSLNVQPGSDFGMCTTL